MCISEATIDLMLDPSAKTPANIYSSLMRGNITEAEVVSLAEHSTFELSDSTRSVTSQLSNIESSVIAA